MSGVPLRLREREEARLSALEQRKAEKQDERRIEETVDHFTRQLEDKKNSISCLLDVADSIAKENLPSYFEKISSECRDLQKFVSDSLIFLTSYDKKTSQQQISDLLQLVTSKQDELLPKKKFAFRSRKKEATASKSQREVIVQQEVMTQRDESDSDRSDVLVCSDANSKIIRDKEKEHLEVTSDEVKDKDIHLSCLKGCEVKLFGAPSTVHITNSTNCIVLSGPVCSSIFIDKCHDCVFVVACQQLRVHSTTSSQFLLHVTSRPIIEDCNQLTFAPYCWTYPEIDDHYKLTGLDRSVNNWNKVNDFNWLSSQDPSPNWSILPEEKRINFTN